MRFLAKYGRFGLQLRTLEVEAYANGTIRVVQEPIYAMFEPLGVSAEERQLALAHFSFEGFYQEPDEATVVPPDHRIGVYDTDIAANGEGWSDDLKSEVEHRLLDYAERFPYIMPAPVYTPTPPWPRYDSYKGAPQALVRKLIDEGHDLTLVLEYEVYSQNRQPVIDAIEEAIANSTLLEEEVVG